MTIARDLANVALLINSSNANVVFDETIVLSSGSANSLVYLNGNKEATTLSTLSFNGTNVGVNNATPGSALDVKGTVRISGAVSGYVGLAVASNAGAVTYTLPASDGLNGNVLSTNGAGSLIWIPMTGGGGGANTGSGSSTSRTTLVATEGQTSFSVNYVVGQIDIFLNGVKLAIGTEVTANTGTTAVLSKGAKAGDIFDAVVYSTQWNTSVTNLFYDGGNIGIGTSIPNYSSFGGTNRVLSIKGSSTYGVIELVSDAAPADGNFLGQFVFANAGSGVTSKDSASIAAKQSGTSATAPGGSLHFYTRTNAGSLTERMMLDASGNLIVGATSSNNNTFVVQGAHTGGRSIAAIRTSTSGNNAPIILGFYDSLDSRQGYVGVNSNSSFVLVSQGNIPMIFNTNETERMRILGTGNVGIGTTNPESTLHITTTPGTYNATVTESANVGGGIIVRANNNGPSSRVGLFLQGSDQIGAAIAAAREDTGTTWRTYLSFYTNNLTGAPNSVTSLQEKMRITSDGNVGIGVNSDSPNAKLHVYGAGSTGYTTYFRTTGSSYTDVGGYGDTTIGNGRWAWEPGTVPGSGTAQFHTHFRTRVAGAGTTQHNVLVDGNVGIGTTSPEYKLDVFGISRFRGTNPARPTTIDTDVVINGESGSWSVGYFFRGNAGTHRGGYGALGTNDTIDYYWIGPDYGTTAFTVNSANNVGIGVNANYKLDVLGSANIVSRFRGTGGLTGVQVQNNIGQPLEIGIYSGGYTAGSNFGVSANGCYVASNSDAPLAVGTIGANPLYFGTGNNERARITSGGNLLVGTTVSETARRVRIYGSEATSAATTLQLLTSTSGTGVNDGFTLELDGSEAYVWNYENANIRFGTNNTERARITSGGELLVGKTSTEAGARLNVRGVDATASNYCMFFDNSAGALLFAVQNDGRWRSGTAAASPYNYVVGATNRDLFVDNGGEIGYVSSVRASKTNIAPVSNVDWLLQLNPVTFNYRKRDTDGNYTEEADGPIKHGLIAEEVEAVNPDLCFYDAADKGGELRGVNYTHLITPMLKLLQEQQALITALTDRLSATEAELSVIKSKLPE